MRFQTTETVPTTDTEKVLHALEASLRDLSDEFERQGTKITLYGLGPSPRARNYRDIAIFDVTTDSGSTTVRADVTFQASALLGASGQDEVVRSKLDYAFDQMRMQLGVPEMARRRSRESMVQEEWVEPSAPDAEHNFGASSDAIEYGAEEPSAWSSILPEATEEDASGEPDSTLLGADPDQVRTEPSETEQVATPFSVWAASLRAVQVQRHISDASAEQSAALEEHESAAPTLMLSAEEHKTNLPIVLAILLGAAVAAGTVYLYWAGMLHRMNLGFPHPKTAAPASQPAPPPVQTPVQAPVLATPAPPPPRHEEADPKVWLEQWAEAMRSRDAELQASFYADPVVRYLDDTNVSREALTTFFRSQIEARNDLWTMKLDRVSIDPLTSSHVVAHLSKHFMELENSSDGAAKQITDRYVRSRLELRRADGEWKIISEQDVTPAGGTR